MIPRPEHSLVRNSDSWRIAYVVGSVGDSSMTLVDHGLLELWPDHYIRPIKAKALDMALMHLLNTNPDAYEAFLDIMLEENR